MSQWIDDLSLKDVRAASTVAFAGEVEFSSARETDSGGRTVQLRLVRTPEDVSKAHPFSRFTRRRRGKGGSRFEASFAMIDGNDERMEELVLLNWTSNPRGDFVDFLVSNEAAQHPFMGCSRPSKDAPGTRWMMIAVERDDDEQIVRQGAAEQLERQRRTGKVQHLSNVARIMTKNERFWEFLSESMAACNNEAIADRLLKEFCRIESKAELDTQGPEGIRKIASFHKLRALFIEWQEAEGYDVTE